jgi:ankyrin repeat protein
MPDGRWMFMDGRPPQNYSEITWTATALRAINLYLPASLAEERDRRVDLAASWLRKQTPRATEESTFQLLGLAWANAPREEVNRAADSLAAQQRSDGGWSQVPALGSDAYSTGQALVALHEAGGMPVTHAAYRRGVAYLMRSQLADGSWLVKTRILHPAEVSPPYFESGFPHGKDQFISIAGTSWAAMALALSLPKIPSRESRTSEPDEEPLPAWSRTALFGTAAELQKLLDGGLDPNSADRDGTTILMMAAPDPEKVRVLLAADAKAGAKSKSRVTPLMVAAAYRAGPETVQLLIDSGAEVEPKAPLPPRKLSPAFLAMIAGDVETVRVLARHGAKLDRKALLFTLFFESDAFSQVVWQGDAPMAAYLAGKISLADLGEAAIIAAHANRANVIRTVRPLRAHVNYVDRHGMTPLLYAASIDYGDLDMIDALLDAGADIKARNEDGATPLALARKYGHTEIAMALEKAGARQ